MGIKASKLPLLFFLSFLLVSATIAFSYNAEDPELEECKHQCQHQERFTGKQREKCEQRCEEYYKQKHGGRGESGGSSENDSSKRDPETQCEQQCRRERQGQERQECREHCKEQQSQKEQQERQFQECRQKCQQQQGRERDQCEQRCRSEYEQGQGGSGSDELYLDQLEGSRGEQQQDENPYVFSRQNFKTKIRSQEGSVRVLPRFSKRSNLLRGIENYRVAILEANPNAFYIPSHWDADSVCFVISGRGAITVLEENNKETHNLQRGDIFRIRAGVSVYMINKDSNEKLYIAELVRPVSNPGKFEAFFGAGGREPESFYNAFSDDILQAAFNTPNERVQRLLRGQRKGAFVRASREQIQSLASHASGHGRFPFRREPQGSYNLFNKHPDFSNNYGELYHADQDDYKELRDLDVAVSFANITKGGMHGPYYNSRSTKIAVVVDGNGYIEMACPHLSSRQQREEQEQEGRQGRQESEEGRQGRQEEEGKQGRQEEEGQQGRQEGHGRQEGRRSPRYQKASARVQRGDTFVVPSGHPFVAVASRDQNFQVMCFEINVENNKKYPLAGKNNIMKQLEREAKELAFDIPARQVEEILEKQNEQWFFPGPQQRQQQQEGRAYE